MRLHPKSLFLKSNTGHTIPYPDGHEVIADVEAEKLRKAGYTEVVEVVETKTGHRLPVIVEGQGGGTRKLDRKLLSRRSDGHFAYLLADRWDALPQTSRDVLLGITKGDPINVAAEEQKSIVADIAAVSAKKAKS